MADPEMMYRLIDVRDAVRDALKPTMGIRGEGLDTANGAADLSVSFRGQKYWLRITEYTS